MALRCRKCGCTNERACLGGCSWISINPPICSACVEQDVGPARVELRSRSEVDQDACPASPIGLHTPIWTSGNAGHCAACREPFICSEAA